MQANVQWQPLNSFTYKTGATHRHTHPKRNGAGWPLLDPPAAEDMQAGVRVWSGTWPPRAVLPTRTCGARSPWKGTGIPARALQHNPPQWDSNSRIRIQRAQPGSYEDRKSVSPTELDFSFSSQGHELRKLRILT